MPSKMPASAFPVSAMSPPPTNVNVRSAGVAAVLGVYTATLGGTACVLWRVDARLVDARLATIALCAFSFASVGCALADQLDVLLVARAVQGAAGAVILAAAGAAVAFRS